MKVKSGFSHFVKYWLPAILWALLIYSFSARPTEAVSEIHWQDFIFKKTIHLVEYGALTLLLFRGFINSGIEKRKALLLSFLIAVVYGMTDEFHQSFTPGRTPKVRDVIIDGVGSFVSLYLVFKVIPKSPGPIKKIARDFELIA